MQYSMVTMRQALKNVGISKGVNAFLWEKGRMRGLKMLGGPESWATAINERGQIVGGSDTKTKDAEGELIWHAVLWTLRR